MHLSCKLTHSVLRFLESGDEDLSALMAGTPVPEEFLRDPSYWIKADDFEVFLGEVVRQSWNTPSDQLLHRIAQAGVEQRSWGVLDSVLRMMSSPAEVFAQPERLLSYFIAPAPPIDKVCRRDNAISFDLPISADQYPLACEFLSRSFEMIPVYMGLPPAECSWNGIRLEINWQAKQNSIFERVDPGRQLSPDLMQDVLKNLGQKEQGQRPEMLAQVKEVKIRPAMAAPEVLEIKEHVTRLSDYMIRAQQLITLMTSSKRLTPDIKEAMRRVNWEHVQTQFPRTVEECYQIFRNHQEKQDHV